MLGTGCKWELWSAEPPPPLTSESIAFLRKKKSLRDESVRVWREEKGGNPTAAAPSPGIFDFLHVVLADLIL